MKKYILIILVILSFVIYFFSNKKNEPEIDFKTFEKYKFLFKRTEWQNIKMGSSYVSKSNIYNVYTFKGDIKKNIPPYLISIWHFKNQKKSLDFNIKKIKKNIINYNDYYYVFNYETKGEVFLNSNFNFNLNKEVDIQISNQSIIKKKYFTNSVIGFYGYFEYISILDIHKNKITFLNQFKNKQTIFLIYQKKNETFLIHIISENKFNLSLTNIFNFNG